MKDLHYFYSHTSLHSLAVVFFKNSRWLLQKKVSTFLLKTVLFSIFLSVAFVAVVDAQTRRKVVAVEEKKVYDLELYTNRATAYYILGYGNLDFFMTQAQVEDKLVEAKMVAAGDIKERVAEIYIYNTFKPDISVFNKTTKQFSSFNFANIGMKELLSRLKKNEAAYRIGHLTEKHSDFFKELTIPRQVGGNWEVKLYLYKRDFNASVEYRLFAVTLNLVAGEQIQNLTIAHANYARRTLEKIYEKYGSPTYKITKGRDAQLAETKLSFDRLFQSSSYQANLQMQGEQEAIDNFSLATQLNISYLEYMGDIANLQITYVAPEYLYDIWSEFDFEFESYQDLLDDGIIGF